MRGNDDNMTLAAVYALKANISLTCQHCGREVRTDAFWLLNRRIPMTTTLGAIRKRLICETCRSRKVEMLVVLRGR